MSLSPNPLSPLDWGGRAVDGHFTSQACQAERLGA